jgi:hypothetical protein
MTIHRKHDGCSKTGTGRVEKTHKLSNSLASTDPGAEIQPLGWLRLNVENENVENKNVKSQNVEHVELK